MKKFMEEIRNALKSLGFGEQEVETYTKMIYLKESTASNLGKEMKAHRRSVYDMVERLVKKGVLTTIEKNGKKYYKPLDPSHIINKLKQKENELKENELKLLEIIPKIWKMEMEKDVRAEILYGKEGIKTMFLDELKVGKTVYIICTKIEKVEDMLKGFLVSYTRDRIKAGIKIKAVSLRDMKKNLEKYRLLEARYIMPENISPSSITIYGNRVAIVLWSDEPVVILVKSQEISDNFLKYFDIIWKSARR